MMGTAKCTGCCPSNANLLGVWGRVGGAGETKLPLTQNVFTGFIAMLEAGRPEPRRVLLRHRLLSLPAGVRPVQPGSRRGWASSGRLILSPRWCKSETIAQNKSIFWIYTPACRGGDARSRLSIAAVDGPTPSP